MDCPTTYEFQGTFSSDLRPTPIVPTSQATLEVLENIHEKHLPHIPYFDHPNLESEAQAACPSSIRNLWEVSESSLAHRASQRVSRNAVTTSVVTPGTRGRGVETARLPPQAQSSEQTAVDNFTHIFECPVRELEVTCILHPGTTQIASRQREHVSPSVSTSPLLQITPTSSQSEREEGRRAIGQALVSVRDRVSVEAWLEGINVMRKRGDRVERFYDILSLGMQEAGGVRNV